MTHPTSEGMIKKGNTGLCFLPSPLLMFAWPRDRGMCSLRQAANFSLGELCNRSSCLRCNYSWGQSIPQLEDAAESCVRYNWQNSHNSFLRTHTPCAQHKACVHINVDQGRKTALMSGWKKGGMPVSCQFCQHPWTAKNRSCHLLSVNLSFPGEFKWDLKSPISSSSPT